MSTREMLERLTTSFAANKPKPRAPITITIRERDYWGLLRALHQFDKLAEGNKSDAFTCAHGQLRKRVMNISRYEKASIRGRLIALRVMMGVSEKKGEDSSVQWDRFNAQGGV